MITMFLHAKEQLVYRQVHVERYYKIDYPL